MNSKNFSELKTLTITLIETYGQKETENNWNESALMIRKLSNLLISNFEKLNFQNEESVELIINVLEQSCFSERTRLALDSIDLLKNVAQKITIDLSKTFCGVIISIFLKLCERSNKIIARSSHEAICAVLKVNSNCVQNAVQLIVEFGRDNCNKFARQTCIEILRKIIEHFDDANIVNNILIISDNYIRLSMIDSCNVVRSSAKKIINHCNQHGTNPFTPITYLENQQTNPVTDFKLLTPAARRVNSGKEKASSSVQKSKGLGKAQRVKLIP